jgi:predicted permease
VSGVLDVLTGFVGLGLVVVVGYLLARFEVVGPGAAHTLTRIVFYAGVPMLMVTTLEEADLGSVFSAAAVVTIGTAATIAVAFGVLARLSGRTDGSGAVIGALSASYVNAGNLGLPILVLVAGTAAPVVPALMLQLLVMVPVSFALLDRTTGRSGPGIRAILSPVTSPPVLGVVAGLVLALTGARLPEPVAMPVGMLADMTVPALLIAFGLSIRGGTEPGDRAPTSIVWSAVVVKTVLAPALALGLGELFGLRGDLLLGVVAVAALPTAQNVFVYAMRYQVHVDLARRAVLYSSALCVPVIVLAAGVIR